MQPFTDARLDVMLIKDIPELITTQERNLGIVAICHQGYNAVIRASHWGQLSEKNIRTGLEWIRQAAVRFEGKSSIAIDIKWISLLSCETINNPSFPMLPLNFNDKLAILFQQIAFLKSNGVIPVNAAWEKINARVNTKLLPQIIQNRQEWQIDSFDYASEKLYNENEGAL